MGRRGKRGHCHRSLQCLLFTVMSAVINTTTEEASLTIVVSGSTSHGLPHGFWHRSLNHRLQHGFHGSLDHGHQRGLRQQHRPRTSTGSQTSALTLDTKVGSSHSTDHRSLSGRLNSENEPFFISDNLVAQSQGNYAVGQYVWGQELHKLQVAIHHPALGHWPPCQHPGSDHSALSLGITMVPPPPSGVGRKSSSSGGSTAGHMAALA